MSTFNINNYPWKSTDNISWKQNYDGMLSTYNKLVEAYNHMQEERNNFRKAFETEQTLHHRLLDQYNKLNWELRSEQENNKNSKTIIQRLSTEIDDLLITIQNIHKQWNETKKDRDDWKLNYNIILKEKNEIIEKYWQANHQYNTLLKLIHQEKS